MNKYLLLAAVVVALLTTTFFLIRQQTEENDFVTYKVNLSKQNLKLYWKDDKGQNFNNAAGLNAWLQSKGQRLVFATNAGMFKKDYSPQGLFVEDRQLLTPLDTSRGSGNFYLKPNGVFYIMEGNKAAICNTQEFRYDNKILYATQSGPMLITDGVVHPDFTKGSGNINIRNGVGILPDGNPVFVMSKKRINFYDFAYCFTTLGCRNALYLDGYVSRTYLPEKNWVQRDGDLGVIVGVVSE